MGWIDDANRVTNAQPGRAEEARQRALAEMAHACERLEQKGDREAATQMLAAMLTWRRSWR